MGTIREAIAEIEDRRRAVAWSTDQFARAAGMTEATFSRYRTGSRTPDTDTLARLRAALDRALEERIAALVELRDKGWAHP